MSKVFDANKLKSTWLKFANHFGYIPEQPDELEFNTDEYCTLLEKCMADNFDYTIKLYGTNPEQLLRKRQPGELIID